MLRLVSKGSFMPRRRTLDLPVRAYPNNPVYFWYEYNNDNQAHTSAHAQ
jgi:hypothetical protein